MSRFLPSAGPVRSYAPLALHVDATLIESPGEQHQLVEVHGCIGIEFGIQRRIQFGGSIQNGEIFNLWFDFYGSSRHSLASSVGDDRRLLAQTRTQSKVERDEV